MGGRWDEARQFFFMIEERVWRNRHAKMKNRIDGMGRDGME